MARPCEGLEVGELRAERARHEAILHGGRHALPADHHAGAASLCRREQARVVGEEGGPDTPLDSMCEAIEEHSRRSSG
jgi:hypothetical protein